MASKNTTFNPRKEFSYIPLVFGIFLIGQVALLIFSLQGSVSSVITSFLLKDIGLAIFVKIIYDSSGKRKKNIKESKTPYESGI